MFNEVLQNSYLLFTLREHYSMPIESDSFSEDNDTPKMNHQSATPKKRKSTSENSIKHEINSQTSSHRTKSPVVSRTMEEKPNDSKESDKPQTVIRKKTSKKRIFSSSIKLECPTTFVEQMLKNEYELQKLCEDHEYSSKQQIHAYRTAVFGPCPFSDIKVQPLKTLQTHNKIILPLKFPWNGVFDTEIPSVKWKDPSIFFFFEASSSSSFEKQ
jgi:hypothetical protein